MVLQGVLERYTQILGEGALKLSGPTSFAPLIRRAIDIVRQECSFHILLILADGQAAPSTRVRVRVGSPLHSPPHSPKWLIHSLGDERGRNCQGDC